MIRRGKKFLTGFTLIELLIVVAVIALLLAILVPALRKASALAKRVVCQNHLKQIALAWRVYLDSNDGYFYKGVNAHLDYGGWEGIVGWGSRPLNRYVNLPQDLQYENNAKVFCCPGDRGGRPGPTPRQKLYRHFGTSYQANSLLIGPAQIWVQDDQFKTLHQELNKRIYNLNINKVDNHSRLLLIGDYGWVNQLRPTPHPNPEWKRLAEWHDKEDCHNMVFLDGHTAFLNIQKGIYITAEYTPIPFKDLYGLAQRAQQQEDEQEEN